MTIDSNPQIQKTQRKQQDIIDIQVNHIQTAENEGQIEIILKAAWGRIGGAGTNCYIASILSCL